MSAKYETTVHLPSNGRLYTNIPEDLVIRAMTTQEEKLLLGSTSDNAFDRILKACIVEPKDINLNELISSDKHFLMLKLRVHTYGSDYNVSCKCPSCGHREDYVIDLDDFPIYELNDEFEEPIDFKLPVSGDEISCKLLRSSDLDYVNKHAKKLSKSLRVSQSELAYNMRMARYIKKVNGKEVDDAFTQSYIQEMHGKDSAYFWYKLNEVQVGYDTTLELECPQCHEEFETAMPITAEFFRPTFRE